MAGYLGSVPVPQATQHRESFTCTEGQTSFATAGYTAQFVDVYLNGSHLSPADFTATNGSDVVLGVAASADDVCDIISYTPFEIASQTFTGTTTMDVAAITGVLTTTAATVSNGGGQFNGAINVGVDGTGHDVKFFGDTASSYMQWDQSTDDLILGGAAALGIGTTTPAYQLTLSSNSTFWEAGLQTTVTGGNQSLKIISDAHGGGGRTGDIKFFTNGAADENVKMHIDNTGAVTMPLQPAFLARPSSGQSNLAINASTTIAFGTEVFDQNADFASNTFTAPVTGRYQLDVSIYAQSLDHDTTYYQLELVTSNRIFYNILSMSGFDADVLHYSFPISVLADMDASDTVFVRMAIPNAGAAQADVNTASHFSGHLVA